MLIIMLDFVFLASIHQKNIKVACKWQTQRVEHSDLRRQKEKFD